MWASPEWGRFSPLLSWPINYNKQILAAKFLTYVSGAIWWSRTNTSPVGQRDHGKSVPGYISTRPNLFVWRELGSTFLVTIPTLSRVKRKAWVRNQDGQKVSHTLWGQIEQVIHVERPKHGRRAVDFPHLALKISDLLSSEHTQWAASKSHSFWPCCHLLVMDIKKMSLALGLF